MQIENVHKNRLMGKKVVKNELFQTINRLKKVKLAWSLSRGLAHWWMPPFLHFILVYYNTLSPVWLFVRHSIWFDALNSNVSMYQSVPAVYLQHKLVSTVCWCSMEINFFADEAPPETGRNMLRGEFDLRCFTSLVKYFVKRCTTVHLLCFTANLLPMLNMPSNFSLRKYV